MHCQRGLDLLEEDVLLLKSSRWVHTSPLLLNGQNLDQEDYLNFVVDVASDLLPDELYQRIFVIEDLIGHPRDGIWRPRKLDIDILFFAQNLDPQFASCDLLTFKKDLLTVPHQGFWQRPFLQKLVVEDLDISLSSLKNCSKVFH